MPLRFNPGHEAILQREIPQTCLQLQKECVQTFFGIIINYSESRDSGLVRYFSLPLCFFSLSVGSVSKDS